MFLRATFQYLLFQTIFGNRLLNVLRKLFVRLERAFQLYQIRIRPTKVRFGPFQGLIYPNKEYSVWERNRIIGCYESCLHKTIYEFSRNESIAYDQILVIGCAEGYYAVGLARLFPNVPILAIDIDRFALTLTEQMAIANGVIGNTTLSNQDAKTHLKNLQGNDKTLIVCDCEGCEFSIFDKNTVDNLINSDLIIEMHYTAAANKSVEKVNLQKDFQQRFEHSHGIETIYPSDNRVEDYSFGYLSVSTMKEFLYESREDDAEWLVLRSKMNWKNS